MGQLYNTMINSGTHISVTQDKSENILNSLKNIINVIREFFFISSILLTWMICILLIIPMVNKVALRIIYFLLNKNFISTIRNILLLLVKKYSFFLCE